MIFPIEFVIAIPFIEEFIAKFLIFNSFSYSRFIVISINITIIPVYYNVIEKSWLVEGLKTCFIFSLDTSNIFGNG